jgi:hypothetical protein
MIEVIFFMKFVSYALLIDVMLQLYKQYIPQGLENVVKLQRENFIKSFLTLIFH